MFLKKLIKKRKYLETSFGSLTFLKINQLILPKLFWEINSNFFNYIYYFTSNQANCQAG